MAGGCEADRHPVHHQHHLLDQHHTSRCSTHLAHLARRTR
ncbi:hypothetical protein [Microcystis phage MinS1]|nr:hypothetical protein [Microcystis phage MinS1]